MAAPTLLWECVKEKSCFLVKRKNAPIMTKEPTNLTSLNKFRFSGLAQRKVLDVTSTVSGKKEKVLLVQRQKKPSKVCRPSASVIQTGLNKNGKKGLAGLDGAISKAFYRTDLVDLAKEKYSKLTMSFKKKKLGGKARAMKKKEEFELSAAHRSLRDAWA
eukprot:CAMPEP_0178453812 /NCGR_PEP_ID=MMETSP0689_2-20121128/45008_1 /TAXON_ID=160604 /ORGANISM="Amphidinium massartii, Strain CS-259" /LENGTH=159 /DNA_ID=CAMNT_0020079671 /DNA_START=75 /DNA_END=552 /DNA_ORIENTATION=-